MYVMCIIVKATVFYFSAKTNNTLNRLGLLLYHRLYIEATPPAPPPNWLFDNPFVGPSGMPFPAFVGALDVISSILSIR